MNATTEFPDIDTDNAVEDDPLAGLGIDFAAEVATIQAEADCPVPMSSPEVKVVAGIDGVERIAAFLDRPVKGSDGLFLDFETIPDHSREHLFGFGPLPTLPPVDGPESLMPADSFVSQGIKEIEAWFAKHNPPEDWVVKVREAEKALPKPRKGAFDAYDEHSQRVNKIAAAASDRIKKMSVTPLFCRICSVSFAVGDDKPVSIWAGDDTMLEKHLLEMCWKMLGRHKRMIGFGVYHFDMNVLITRSMLLGVHPSIVLDRKKYGNSNVVDLMRELYGDSPAMGMKPTCKLMGIEPDAGDCEGSQVYEMFKAGHRDEICKYNESDVVLCQKLRRKMAGYFTA